MGKNVNRQCKKNGYILRIVNYDMFFLNREHLITLREFYKIYNHMYIFF